MLNVQRRMRVKRGAEYHGKVEVVGRGMCSIPHSTKKILLVYIMETILYKKLRTIIFYGIHQNSSYVQYLQQ